MSTNGIEKAFWTAVSDPAQSQRLREDASAFLQGFNVDEQERSLVLGWDVSALAARGVNPLLLLTAFSTVYGPQRLPEYLAKINQPHALPRAG